VIKKATIPTVPAAMDVLAAPPARNGSVAQVSGTVGPPDSARRWFVRISYLFFSGLDMNIDNYEQAVSQLALPSARLLFGCIAPGLAAVIESVHLVIP
jgi:hypothetical protein